MDVTMIGLQNAGKTSLLRVLAVSTTTQNHLAVALTACFSGGRVHHRVGGCISSWLHVRAQSHLRLTLMFNGSSIPTVGFNMKRVQKGHVTLKWYVAQQSLVVTPLVLYS